MMPVVATKLLAPIPHPAAVRRSRLLQRLDDGLQGGARLLLVEAPAGYGKSTLLATWLAAAGRPYSWLALDEGDDDLAHFTAGFTAALRQVIGEGAGQAAESLLSLPQAPAPEAVAGYLVADLLHLEQPVIVVLDDYHVIRAPEVHRTVQALLDRRPPGLHVVIATRADPPLTIARWRARGEVTEIRAGELRFTTDEAGEFLRRTMKLTVPDEAVTALGARTEGWAAGLQLAGLSLQRRDAEGARKFIATFSGSHRYIIDYLADEVLREQSPDLRDFLCRTAVLDRLSAPLCDAVTERSDSRSMLATLEQANLFLVPLDDQREWYRYHHLFRDVLRSELPQAQQAELHGRAAVWFESQGLLADAIRHATAANDAALLLRLVKRGAADLIYGGNIRLVLRWLELLPQHRLLSDPELGVHRLWALFTSGQFAEATAWLAQLDAAMSGEVSPMVKGRVACVRAWLAGFALSPELVRLAEEALQLVPPADLGCRSATLLLQSNVCGIQGDSAGTESFAREAYRAASSGGFTFLAVSAVRNLVIWLQHQGRVREAVALCEDALATYSDREGNPLPVAGPILIQLGQACYWVNRTDDAERHVLQGIEFCRQTGFETHTLGEGERLLAALAGARGAWDEALVTLRRGREATERAHLPLALEMECREAMLLIRRGELAAAARMLEAVDVESPITPHRVLPCLAVARLWLARGQLPEAAGLLERLAFSLRTTGTVSHLIPVLLLQAQAAGGSRAAGFLAEAIALAAPEGLIRPFLDEGEAVLRLLPAVRAVAPDFVDSLVPVARKPPVAQGPAGDGLTDREQEMLRLVAAGRSNEEIAGQLFISVTTAKWHVRNLYDKLGVHSRTQAVAKGRELGLL